MEVKNSRTLRGIENFYNWGWKRGGGGGGGGGSSFRGVFLFGGQYSITCSEKLSGYLCVNISN